MRRGRLIAGVAGRSIAGLAAFYALAGCTRVEPARLRVAHGVTEGAALDVCVDGKVAFARVMFGGVSTYEDVGAEAHRLRIIAAGAGCETGAAVGLDVTPGAQTDTTLLLVGADAGVTTIVLSDDNRSPRARESRLRVVNALLDGTTVDLTLDTGVVLFEDVLAETASAYLDIESDTYALRVRGTGGQAVIASLDDVELLEGNVYTLFAFGPSAGEPAARAVLAVDRR